MNYHYLPIGTQEEIHEGNIMVSSWVNCPCEADRARQREAGKPVAQFAITGVFRILKAEVFEGYGRITESGGRIIYCSVEHAAYAERLLSTPPVLFVTATLDQKGNVVKVS